jgi:hypothetical protein
MRSSESVRKYGHRVKALIQKLTTEISPSLQVEWYVAGLPESMGFLMRQSRPRTLREAIDAATNYENSAQSLRKSLKRSERQEKGKNKKYDRKTRNRKKISDSDSSSESSEPRDSHSSPSDTEEEGSISPPKHSVKSKSRREKIVVKVKAEDPDSKKMMRSIQQSLEAIKVNLADNRKTRRVVPTSRANVWCGRCGELGHYPSECQRASHQLVHYVYPEEEVYYTMGTEEEEEVFQVQPTYGRGKGIAIPVRSTPLNRSFVLVPNLPPPVQVQGYSGRHVVICYGCGEPGHYANECPYQGQTSGAPRVLPCHNCHEYGHLEDKCPHPRRSRPVFKQEQILPREQTVLNYGHTEGVEKPEK